MRWAPMRVALDGELAAGDGDRAAGHHHRARAPGPRRIGRHGGIAEDHADPRHGNAEDFMGDLGQRRFETLPMRMDPDAQFEAAVRRHSRARLLAARHHRNAPAGIDRRAMRGLLAIDREAEPDAAPVRLAFSLAGADRIGVDRLQGARSAPEDSRRCRSASCVMLSNGICSGRTRFLNRTVSGLSPAAEATASSASSNAKQTPVLATPR